VLIIDDPIKPQDAHSEAVRNATNEWYFNTLLSRLNDKTNGGDRHRDAASASAGSRREVLDREKWEVISLPAIAVTDEKPQH